MENSQLIILLADLVKWQQAIITELESYANDAQHQLEMDAYDHASRLVRTLPINVGIELNND